MTHLRHLLPVLALACAAQDPGGLPVGSAPPPNLLTLEVPGVYAGYALTFTVEGAVAGDTVRLYGSRRPPGTGPCLPSLGGACLELDNAGVLGTAVADGDGVATGTLSVPANARGPAALQAAVVSPGGPATSPPLVVRIVAAGTDTDGDGLPDGQEATVLGTDRFSVDSDDDQLDDGDEVAIHGTDPANPDSDGDGAWDGVEVWYGYDPHDPDQDGDGIPDGDDLDLFAPGPVDAFVPDDQMVSDPAVTLFDPEFVESTGQAAWQTRDGSELWAFDVDPATGAFVPPDGRGVLVDANIAPTSYGANGPEWSNSIYGQEIVYVHLDHGVPVLWHARQIGGVWRNELMPGRTEGVRPQGHRNPGVLEPYVTVRIEDPSTDIARRGWRTTTDPNSARYLPSRFDGEDGHRWVLDATPAVVGTALVQGVEQAWVYDVSLGQGTFVTTGPGWKADARSWIAPEWGDRAFVLRESDNPDLVIDIAVYRDGPGGLQKVKTIRPPPGTPMTHSAEVFTWNGRSYVTFTAGRVDADRNTVGAVSEIWIAAVDPADPLMRKVSDADIIKGDPEGYTGGVRPWVYYTQLEPRGVRHIRRCELGL